MMATWTVDKYDGTTPKFILNDAGKWAVQETDECCCGGSVGCSAAGCTAVGAAATFTVAGGTCTCIEGSYSWWGKTDWHWQWMGGYCDFWGGTDFLFDLECRGDGSWRGLLTSSVSGYTWAEGTATTADLTCVGGAFSGSIDMTGKDLTGDSGPNCSSATITASW